MAVEAQRVHPAGNPAGTDEAYNLAAKALLGDALVYIDLAAASISGANDAAAALLGLSKDELPGQSWEAVLGKGNRAAFAQVLAAGVKTTLPPMVLRRPNGTSRVVTGVVAPGIMEPPGTVVLLLKECASTYIEHVLEELQETDTVAVLGVDQLIYDAGWTAADAADLMLNLRSGLLDIVRTQDTVSLPAGTSITIVLRDCVPERAQDIARALLSHLRPQINNLSEGAESASICIGLAPAAQYEDALAAAVAANNALAYAQSTRLPGRIKMAGPDDAQLVAGNHRDYDGVFSGSVLGTQYSEFLSRLLELPWEERTPEHYVADIIQLCLGQPGAQAMAVFRHQSDDSYQFMTAAECDGAVLDFLTEKTLPQPLLEALPLLDSARLSRAGGRVGASSEVTLIPLRQDNAVLGCIMLLGAGRGVANFMLDDLACRHVSMVFGLIKGAPDAPGIIEGSTPDEPAPMATPIKGYVGDNMEGAVDQAVFLAKVDIPVAIIGPRGTGKLYVARVIHQEAGGDPGGLEVVDCREFRTRDDAIKRIGRALRDSEGKTLVFKSPHLMNAEAQVKLARQLTTRILADVTPPRYLPRAKYVALFPDTIESMLHQGALAEKLASAFAGYPINVPPIKDRKQAVLRWAYKILGQESEDRQRPLKGFTPDAEQAMLMHEWPGNISEMRQCIVNALGNTDNEWITPVDLGIFKGISVDETPPPPLLKAFLGDIHNQAATQDQYTPSAWEELEVALGEAVNAVISEGSELPLGAWLLDEMVLAATARYDGELRSAAEFLHTKPRNISRWIPKIEDREAQRLGADVWQESRRLIREWIREAPHPTESPQELMQDKMMMYLEKQRHTTKVGVRAKILGVSIPTYQKRLQDIATTGKL